MSYIPDTIAGSVTLAQFPALSVAGKASLEEFTSTTLTDVTGLSVSVVSGGKYIVDGAVLFECTIVTAGLSLALTCPTGTIRVLASVPIAASGTAMMTSGMINASGSAVTSTAVGTANTVFLAPFQGIFAPTANGTLQVQVAPNTAVGSPTITIRPSSYIRALSIT